MLEPKTGHSKEVEALHAGPEAPCRERRTELVQPEVVFIEFGSFARGARLRSLRLTSPATSCSSSPIGQ